MGVGVGVVNVDDAGNESVSGGVCIKVRLTCIRRRQLSMPERTCDYKPQHNFFPSTINQQQQSTSTAMAVTTITVMTGTPNQNTGFKYH